MDQVMVGVDVSKAWLDAHVAGTNRRLRVANDAAGLDALVGRLGSGIRVVMEASGGYERLAHRTLVARGVWTAIVNPKRVRDFARGMGYEAKTDRVDAAVIARYGAVTGPAATPVPAPEREALAELLACRRQLIDELTVRRQQLEHLRSAGARQLTTAMIDHLVAKRAELDRLLDRHVADHPPLQHLARQLMTMPGCGRTLAYTLLADMPELGSLDRRGIAALAGLAPVARDSGLRANQRVIKGGRGQIRRVLYMAAVSATHARNNPFKTRYQALVARGKPPKLALTAVMRHMIVTLNAMARDNQTWKP